MKDCVQMDSILLLLNSFSGDLNGNYSTFAFYFSVCFFYQRFRGLVPMNAILEEIEKKRERKKRKVERKGQTKRRTSFSNTLLKPQNDYNHKSKE